MFRLCIFLVFLKMKTDPKYMKNLKDRFIDYLLGLNSYSLYLDSRGKCENFVSDLEEEYEKAFGKILSLC